MALCVRGGRIILPRARVLCVSGRRRQSTHTGDAQSRHAEYWRKIPVWSDIPKSQFLDYSWQMKSSLQTGASLLNFLKSVLPPTIPTAPSGQSHERPEISSEEFTADVAAGMQRAPMATRLTPHILSLINWSEAYSDPIRRQFIPLASCFQPDHPQLSLDSLHESLDSPVKGLVHRYPDKVLFLGTTTETVSKKRFLPLKKRWEQMFEYIANTPAVTDVVVSGGDSFVLEPDQLRFIGMKLLDIENVRRVRFASKGISVCPSRVLDPEDEWTNTLIEISNEGRRRGKSIAVHTHFNHPNEISWITALSAQKLFENAVTVRNQTVLLKGVNNDVTTMKRLIRGLADINIQPYYVYQGDMVQGVEDLRTPLRDILHIESHVRGTIAGFMTPSFVVDLPGGGGKRLAATFQSYDQTTGVSKFVAPGVKGDTVHEYYDPLWSLAASSEPAETLQASAAHGG
ncbi:hypothetical protein FQN54_005707 [Arachnomyces sp. PD_36]|nr:hypothetical protein FQN54_005707 [Arachnomyces sp. PD_36]